MRSTLNVCEHFENEHNEERAYLYPKKSHRKRYFKACEVRKSGAYFTYVSILQTSITQKEPFYAVFY